MKDIKEIIRQQIIVVLKEFNYYSESISINLERPKQESHGDWSSNIALQLASVAKKNPRLIATEIKDKLNFDSTIIEKIELAGPGFINFYLGFGYYWDSLKYILEQKDNFGRSDWGNNKKIQVEFVSANPTGPLNVVSARAAAIGDIIVKLYNEVGFQAHREFYVNDAGRQVRLLGASVSSRYMDLFNIDEEFPDEGYHGEYIIDLAKEISKEFGDKFAKISIEERHEQLSQISLRKMNMSQKEIMEQYRVNFETWFNESQLRDKDEHFDVLKYLEEKGHTYKKDDAIWFQSEKFGDEKDRVLITSEGEPTYFLVDIAYHRNKYQRGYKKLYDIWGPDHHGYIPRMKAAIQALGYQDDSFQVEIVQQVNLLRGGEVIKMSKRAGQIIEMKEVIDEVGVDAARFFFVNRKCNSHLDFDIDLAKKRTDENPVFYVQYAHARICNIILHGHDQGIEIDNSTDYALLKDDREKLLIKKILQYPDIISNSAKYWEPHRLTNYLQELAATFHQFYHFNRVVNPEDPELSKARLILSNAVKIVLANGFRILGISAPERM